MRPWNVFARLLVGLLSFLIFASLTISLGIPAKAAQSGLRDVIVELRGQPLADMVANTANGGRTPDAEAQSAYLGAIRANQAAVESTLTAYGAHIITRYDTSYNGLWVRVPVAQLDSIAALPDVVGIYPNVVFRTENGPSVDYINAPQLWQQGSGSGLKGDGIKIGIIDSGIDYTHKLLGGSGSPADYADAAGADGKALLPATSTHAPLCANVPAHFPTQTVVGGYDFVGYDFDPTSPTITQQQPQPDCNPMDDGDHGTHVAGIVAGGDATGLTDPLGRPVYGVAPHAQVYAIKVFGHVQKTSTAVLLAALDYALDPINYGSSHRNVTKNHLNIVTLALASDYGDNAGPLTDAIDRAARVGLLTVTAAGNANGSAYSLGAPAIAPHALAVVAAIDNAQVGPAITVTAPANVGPFPMIEGSHSAPLTTSGITATAVVGTNLGAVDGTTVSTACTPFTNAAALAGAIAIVDDGDCPAQTKADRVAEAGAVGLIIIAGQDPVLIAPDVTTPLPMVMTDHTSGVTLKATPNLTVTLASLSANHFMAYPQLAGTLAAFSSAGPGNGSSFKPEVAAPGQGIYSAQTGGGSSVESKSGTSLAAAHVAGAAALLLQAHPAWTADQIKQALMLAATPLRSADTSLYPFGQQGAGLVDVVKASTVQTFVSNSAGQGSLSYGMFDVVKKRSLRQKLTITNTGATAKTYSLNFQTIESGMTVAYPKTLTLKPRSSIGVLIQATFDPATIRRSTDRAMEYDGTLTVSDAHDSTDSVRVPVMAVPLVAAQIRSQRVHGTLTVSNPSSPMDGAAQFFTLGRWVPTPCLLPMVDPTTGDIVCLKRAVAPNIVRAVGARTSSDNTGYAFAIVTNRQWANPLSTGFDTYICLSGGDCTPKNADFVASTGDARVPLGQPTPTGRLVVAYYHLHGAATPQLIGFTDVTADKNSNVLSFVVPYSALGVNAAQKISYRVVSFLPYTTALSYYKLATGVATFDPAQEARVLDASHTRIVETRIAPGTATTYTQSGTAALLMLYPDNAGKNRQYQILGGQE